MDRAKIDDAARVAMSALDDEQRMLLAFLFSGRMTQTGRAHRFVLMWLARPGRGFRPPDRLALRALRARLVRAGRELPPPIRTVGGEGCA